MKKVIIILFIVLFFLGCASVRYGDNLQPPYSQNEMDMGGIVAIGFGVSSLLLGQYVLSEVK